jgi:8-oxo-dGTP diphosphatase
METGQNSDLEKNQMSSNTNNRSPGHQTEKLETPKLCVDLIIDMGAGMIVLIERKNEPKGWALPGGFVDIGETVEEAGLREAYEETGLDIEIVRQFHVYSDPKRDPRGQHSASVVLSARGWGKPKAGDDALKAELFHEMNLPENIAFDHRQIIKDYFGGRY